MGFKIRLTSGRDLIVGWLKEDFTIPPETEYFERYLNSFAFDAGTSLFRYKQYRQQRELIHAGIVSHPYIEDTESPTDGIYIEQLGTDMYAYNIQNIDESHLGQIIGYEQNILSKSGSQAGITNVVWSYQTQNNIKNYDTIDRSNPCEATDPDKCVLVFVPFGQKPGNITDVVIMMSWQFSKSFSIYPHPEYNGLYYRFLFAGNGKEEFINFLNGSAEVSEPAGEPVPDDFGDYRTESDPVNPPSIADINTVSVLSTNLLRAYELTAVNVESLGQKLWDDSFFNNIKKLQNSPIDNIIKLHCLPFNVASGNEEEVYIGNVDMNFQAKVIEDQFQEVDFGTVDLTEFYGNSLDYIGTSISLFLPFIGQVSLGTSDVNAASIHLKYRIDICTGNITAFLKVSRNRDDTDLKSVLYQWTGNCSNEFPLNQQTNQTLSKLYNSAVGIASNPTNIGGYLSAAKTGLDAVLGGEEKTIQRSGNLSGSSGYMGVLDAFLIIERPINIKPENYKDFFGYPSYYTAPLSECQGFTKVKTMISAMPQGVPVTEWDEVVRLLQEGIIIGDYYLNPVDPTPSPSPTPTPSITIDTQLSLTSINAVQNKVITKGIYDAKDEAIQSANTYTNNQRGLILNDANNYADEKDITTLNRAKTYADNSAATYSANAFKKAKEYADLQDVTILGNAKSYSDGADETTLQNAKDYADGLVDFGFSDTGSKSSSISSGGTFQAITGCYLTLQPGSYIIIASASFTANSTGYREINIGESGSNASGPGASSRVNASASTSTQLITQLVRTLNVTTASNYYVNARQTSNANMTVQARLYAVKLK